MMSRLRLFASALLCAIGLALPVQNATAQEFDCDVTVNYTQLEGSRFTFLDELEELLEQYLNGHRWTEDRYLDHERIQCNLSVVFQEAISLTNFRAQLIVLSRRPIYGTTQSTNVVRINDNNWTFQYTQGDPLTRNIESFDALTSVLDFYAYLMLGYDYDTFSALGGTPHFQRARRIAELAQGQSAAGWSTIGGDRTRSELITQLLDPRFQPLREGYFTYHFEGLDHFVIQTEEARLAVLDMLGDLEELYENLSRQYSLDLFFDTKYQELSALFEASTVRNEAYEVLSQVDAAHLSEYNKLTN